VRQSYALKKEEAAFVSKRFNVNEAASEALFPLVSPFNDDDDFAMTLM